MTLSARAVVDFPAVAEYIDRIVQSLVGHDIAVTVDGTDRTAHFPGGTCRLEVETARLILVVEAADATALNVAKHGVTSLAQFVAASQKLEIAWTGDEAGPSVPPDLRELRVERVTDLSPRMRRFTLRGADLGHWADDRHLHCRLLFQPAVIDRPEWPMIGQDGQILWPQGERRLLSRIYTIRHIDAAAGLLDIDFVLHDGTSPGCDWARRSRPGDIVGMIGRGAMGPRPANWYLLAGDETGLPGIARILEGLPDTAHGVALIEVADAAEEQALRCPPGIELRWLHRDGSRPGTTTLIIDAVRALPWPTQGSVFAWGGCEHTAFRALRDHLRRERVLPREAMVNYPHWRRGMSEEDIVSTGGEAVD